jgi:endonuclease/exonuclease/phosphatase (EEP) superfamily protein YafD
VLGLAAPWLGLLGKWHWLLDLCTHFRWQALVVCAVALGWAVAKRRRVVLGVALLSLALNGWLFFKIAAAPSSGNVRPDFMVRIVSLNVLTSNPDHAAVLTFLQQADADILFLMEVDQRWAQALQPLLLTHPHHLIKPRQDNFGLALFSRLPLEELRLLSAEELAPGTANELIQDLSALLGVEGWKQRESDALQFFVEALSKDQSLGGVAALDSPAGEAALVQGLQGPGVFPDELVDDGS